MRIRKGLVSDLSVLNKISYAAKKHWGYPEKWMNFWKEDLLLKDADFERETVKVVELSAKIIGFGSIVEKEAYYEVTHLWLLPDYIGMGFGGLLLNDMLSLALSNKPIRVVADPNAEAFYQKQGFSTFDQVESFPKGRFLPLMEKGILQTDS